MILSPGWLRQYLLGISAREVMFTRRGFRGGEIAAQQRLEQIGHIFRYGYHMALRDDTMETLGDRLSEVEAEWCGFAFEGAGMALALLDQLTPWKRHRLSAFLAGAGAIHTYIVHVGAGWALALLHRRVERPVHRFDVLLRWLAVDGYGFYHGYFHWPRAISAQVVPSHMTGYACRAFDQGLGRSLWFVEGADVARIPATIATFPPGRQADLWSGVGLACAYAGSADRDGLSALGIAAGTYRPHLAQGVIFAAKARQRAGNPAAHTALACRVLCAMSTETAAEVADAALQDLPPDAMVPAYEVWRQRIQAHFVSQVILP